MRKTSALLSLMCFGLALTATPAKADFQIVHAGTVTTSGNYVWGVAVGNVITKYASGVKVKTMAIGAGGVTLPMIRKGQANMASAIGMDLLEDAYNGAGRFKSAGPNKKLRMFLLREMVYFPMWVTERSGIKNFTDLKGHKINSGNPGSTAQASALAMEATLHTGVTWAPGSTPAAVASMQNRQIDGYWRSAPALPPGPHYKLKFDSTALLINISNPLTVVGFTKAQMQEVKKKFPNIRFAKIDAGGFINKPEMGAFWLTIVPAVATLSSDVPQEIQYKMAKAVAQHLKYISDAYAPARPWDPLKGAVIDGDVPLAAGVVQYLKEQGVKVPSRLIPPEYKQ